MSAAPSDQGQHLVHTISLGDFHVTTISDGAVTMDARPLFLLDHDDAELAAISAKANLPFPMIKNGFTPALVDTGQELVLFDTGMGQLGHDRGAGRLCDGLVLAGHHPEDIDVIAFTHMHPDHIGGLLQDETPVFPNARLVMGRQEFDRWKDGDDIPEQRAQNRALFLKTVAPLEDRFTFLEDGDAVVPGITAMAAYGHSPGHMMYRVESNGQRCLVWGDLATHPVYSVGYPDSPVFFDDNKEMAIATRNRVLDMAYREQLLIIGFHMPFPSIGTIALSGDIFSWVPFR